MIRSWLSHRTDAIARENLSRGGAFPLARALRLAGTAGIIAGMVWFLAVRIGAYFDFQGSLQADPQVWNLTKAGVEWDVFYGQSPKCGDQECLLLPETPASAFQKKMVLPAREFPLEDYKKGDIVYLRTALTIPEHLRKLDQALSFQSIYVWAERYTFYVNGVPVDEGSEPQLLNVTLPRALVARDAPVHLALRIDPGSLPYQGLAHRADLYVGPKATLAKTVNDAYEFKTVYFLWFLLPKLTFSLVFALLFLAVARHAELFSFIVFAFLSTTDGFLHSGYPDQMLGTAVDWQLAGLMVRCFVAIAFMRFIHDFFRRHDAKLYLFQWTAGLALVVFAIASFTVLPKKTAFDSAVFLSETLRLVSYGYAIYTSALMLVYLTATKLSPFRQRVALALTVFYVLALGPVAFDSGFKILELFGMAPDWLGLNLTWICDLALFFLLAGITAMEFGLTLSAKEISDARTRALEGRLELALTVQRLLLPRQLSAATESYSYRFHHEPAEQMSGDWINIWHDDAAGERRLIFGDVVGKGPQAALAVSAIASVISDAKLRKLPLEECFRNINEHLRRLFDGHIYSTLAAVVLRDDRRADLYSCGAVGWVVAGPEGANVVAPRGTPLGLAPNAHIGRASVTLMRDQFLVSFTDGCLDGARAVKKLVQQLATLGKEDALDADAILAAVLTPQMNAVKPDDRTALVVSGDRWDAAEVAAAQRAAEPKREKAKTSGLAIVRPLAG